MLPARRQGIMPGDKSTPSSRRPMSAKASPARPVPQPRSRMSSLPRGQSGRPRGAAAPGRDSAGRHQRLSKRGAYWSNRVRTCSSGNRAGRGGAEQRQPHRRAHPVAPGPAPAWRDMPGPRLLRRLQAWPRAYRISTSPGAISSAARIASTASSAWPSASRARPTSRRRRARGSGMGRGRVMGWNVRSAAAVPQSRAGL